MTSPDRPLPVAGTITTTWHCAPASRSPAGRFKPATHIVALRRWQADGHPVVRQEVRGVCGISVTDRLTGTGPATQPENASCLACRTVWAQLPGDGDCPGSARTWGTGTGQPICQVCHRGPGSLGVRKPYRSRLTSHAWGGIVPRHEGMRAFENRRRATVWNGHSNQLGDWCPWSGTRPDTASLKEENPRCPAGCPDSRPARKGRAR